MGAQGGYNTGILSSTTVLLINSFNSFSVLGMFLRVSGPWHQCLSTTQLNSTFFGFSGCFQYVICIRSGWERTPFPFPSLCPAILLFQILLAYAPSSLCAVHYIRELRDTGQSVSTHGHSVGVFSFLKSFPFPVLEVCKHAAWEKCEHANAGRYVCDSPVCTHR